MTVCHRLLIIIFCFIHYCLSDVIEAYHIGANLEKNVSSSSILDRYDNGHCIYPGVCDIPINKCNLPKIPLSSLTYDNFVNNYVIKQRPVIIQMCPHTQKNKECDLSSIIDNVTKIWEWNKIISIVRPNDYKNIYKPLEQNGTPSDRADTCDIHPLNDRNKNIYQAIINSTKQIPLILQDLDFFNDLIGYLKSTDGPLLGNKWIVYGTAGSGAPFHFDYYLTSFWNMVVQGSKYWFLINPDVVEKYLFQNEKDLHDVISMPVWQFWIQIYPYIDEILLNQNIDISNEENSPYYQCMQHKGDIVYTPSKWYHATINLNATLSISRNMITKFNYQKVFKFVTSLQSMHSINTDTRQVIGVKHAVDLCAALYHYNVTMWRNTYCATKLFLQRLNSFELLFDDKNNKNVWNWYHHSGKPSTTNSKLYIDACNYAARHATFSSFR